MLIAMTIVPGLAAHGIFLRRWDDLTDAQKEEAAQYFERDISPALTPLVINPEHPFPFLSNLSTSLTFRLHDPERGDQMVARIKIPGSLRPVGPAHSRYRVRQAPSRSALRSHPWQHPHSLQRHDDLPA